PTLRALNERILRQQPLDAKKSAKTTAAGTVTVRWPAAASWVCATCCLAARCPTWRWASWSLSHW
ncbi:hypothetical protein GR255_19680, partial [Mycobacterium tuberculosis]|nr:hypothetical protein [Mycobacterium tuberculosis]